MATGNAVDEVAQAIHRLLWATGAFKTGTPYTRRAIGTTPAYMVWWDGCSFAGEPQAKPMPTEITHRYQVELFSKLTGNEDESQGRFNALVQTAVTAIRDNPRLNRTCLRSKVTEVTPDIWTADENGNNPHLQATIIIDAVRTDW